MIRLAITDLRRHSGVWAGSFVVTFACAVVVSAEFAVARGSHASALATGDTNSIVATDTMLSFTLACISVAAIAILTSTTHLALAARRRDIGLWRALGMRPRDVNRILLAEVAVFRLVAGLLGSLCAVPAGRILTPALISERVALPGTVPVLSFQGSLASALLVASISGCGAFAALRDTSLASEAQLLRGGTGEQGNRRWRRGVRVLLAGGAGALVVVKLRTAHGDQTSQIDAVVWTSFALFVLILILTPWIIPLVDKGLAFLFRRKSVSWYLATHICAEETARSSAIVLPFFVAVSIVGMLFGGRATGIGSATPAGVFAMFGPALFVAWVGCVGVIAMTATRRRRDAALLEAAGARGSQIVSIDLFQGAIHSVVAVILGLIPTVGSMLVAADVLHLDVVDIFAHGPWAHVAVMGGATFIVIEGAIVLSRNIATRHNVASGLQVAAETGGGTRGRSMRELSSADEKEDARTPQCAPPTPRRVPHL